MASSSLPPLSGKPLTRDELAQYVFSTSPITIDTSVQEKLSLEFIHRFKCRNSSVTATTAAEAVAPAETVSASSVGDTTTSTSRPSPSCAFSSSLTFFAATLPPVPPGAPLLPVTAVRATAVLRISSLLHAAGGVRPALLAAVCDVLSTSGGNAQDILFPRHPLPSVVAQPKGDERIPLQERYPSALAYMLGAASTAAESVISSSTCVGTPDGKIRGDTTAAAAGAQGVKPGSVAASKCPLTLEEAATFCCGDSEAAGRLFVVTRYLSVLVDLLDSNTALLAELLLIPTDYFSQQQKHLPQIKGIQTSATNISVLLHDSKLQHLPRKTPDELAYLFPTLERLLPAVGNLREALQSAEAYIDAELKFMAAATSTPHARVAGATSETSSKRNLSRRPSANVRSRTYDSQADAGAGAGTADSPTVEEDALSTGWPNLRAMLQEQTAAGAAPSALYAPVASSLKAALDAVLCCFLKPHTSLLNPLLQEAAAAAATLCPKEQHGGLMYGQYPEATDFTEGVAGAKMNNNVHFPDSPPTTSAGTGAASCTTTPSSPTSSSSSSSSAGHPCCSSVFLAFDAVSSRAELARHLQQRFGALRRVSLRAAMEAEETLLIENYAAEEKKEAAAGGVGMRGFFSSHCEKGGGIGGGGCMLSPQSRELFPHTIEPSSLFQILEIEQRVNLLQQTLALQTALLLQLVEVADMRAFFEAVEKSNKSKGKKKPPSGRYLMSFGARRYSSYLYGAIKTFLAQSTSLPLATTPRSFHVLSDETAADTSPSAKQKKITLSKDKKETNTMNNSLSSSDGRNNSSSSHNYSNRSRDACLGALQVLFGSVATAATAAPAAAAGGRGGGGAGNVEGKIVTGEGGVGVSSSSFFLTSSYEQSDGVNSGSNTISSSSSNSCCQKGRGGGETVCSPTSSRRYVFDVPRLVLQDGLLLDEETDDRRLVSLLLGAQKQISTETKWRSWEGWLETQREHLGELLRALNQMRRVPKVPKGTQDFTPQQMVVRSVVLGAVREIFQQHGGVEIDTPVFELRETLLGKYGENQKLVYDLKDQGGEQLSLRYDLTVPFARYVASHDVEKIRRFHIGKVYRRDEPQMMRGRCREFYQCDFDIAGPVALPPTTGDADLAGACNTPGSPTAAAESGRLLHGRGGGGCGGGAGGGGGSGGGGLYPWMATDAEAITILVQVLRKLQLRAGPFCVKINHRQLLDGVLLDVCGVPADMFATVCSSIDKLDKEPWEIVRLELLDQKGVPPRAVDLIERYILSFRGPLKQVVEELYHTLLVQPPPSQQEEERGGRGGGERVEERGGRKELSSVGVVSSFASPPSLSMCVDVPGKTGLSKEEGAEQKKNHAMRTVSISERGRGKIAAALADLKRLQEYLEAMGVKHSETQFDLSLARGLDYYTGVIFEAILISSSCTHTNTTTTSNSNATTNNTTRPSTTTTTASSSSIGAAAHDGPGSPNSLHTHAKRTTPFITSVGSVGAGGRYDNLVGMFSGKNVPAVGLSVGVERLFRVIEASLATDIVAKGDRGPLPPSPAPSSSCTSNTSSSSSSGTSSSSSSSSSNSNNNSGTSNNSHSTSGSSSSSSPQQQQQQFEEKQQQHSSNSVTAASLSPTTRTPTEQNKEGTTSKKKKSPATSNGSSTTAPNETTTSALLIRESCTDVLVCAIGDNLIKTCMHLAGLLWERGLAAEFYAAEGGAKLKRQMDYACQRRIPLLVIIGENEFKKKMAKIRPLVYASDQIEDKYKEQHDRQQHEQQQQQQQQQQTSVVLGGREGEKEVSWDELPDAVHALLQRRGTSWQRTRRLILQ